jgi:MFS family permease
MSQERIKTLTPMFPTERRAVAVVALIAMIRMFGLFALLPVLSLYAVGLDGATPTLIGFAVGAYGLTQASLQIPLGALSDRIGRLPVILAGLAIFAAGSLLAADSTTIGGVIAGRLLQGAGAISATLTALLADATREEVRTRSMAIFGVGIGVSFLLALIIGPIIAAASGVRSLFYVAAAVAVVAAFLTLFLPKGIQRPATSQKADIREAFRSDLVRLDLYIFALHTLLTAMFVALPFMLRERLGLLLADQWKIYVGALAISLLGTLPLIVVDERKGKTGTISIAVALLLLGLLGLTFFGVSYPLVLAALAIFFAGFNFLEAGLPARLSILAHGPARGASLGVFSSFQFLGAFVGGMLGGWFFSTDHPQDVFFACAVLTGFWLLLHQLGRNAINMAD